MALDTRIALNAVQLQQNHLRLLSAPPQRGIRGKHNQSLVDKTRSDALMAGAIAKCSAVPLALPGKTKRTSVTFWPTAASRPDATRPSDLPVGSEAAGRTSRCSN